MSFRRASKANPCEICGRHDWCGVTDDGYLAVCMRVESNKPSRNGGYLHKLRDGDRPRSRVRRVRVPMKSEPVLDFDKLTEQYEHAARDNDVARLAAVLGLSTDALRRLSIGYDGESWTFPMRDEERRVTGIRRRFHDGRKLSVKGGHEGLFIPLGLSGNSTVLICEGPTDTAAMLTLGLAAIGRPNCRGGVKQLVAFCRGRRVAIMADGDEPGRVGAWILATALKLVCSSVVVIHPPNEIKDARDWLQSGGTKADIQKAIDLAEPVSVRVVAV